MYRDRFSVVQAPLNAIVLFNSWFKIFSMTVVLSTDPDSSSPSPTLEKQWEGEGMWEEDKAGGTARTGH